MDALHQFVEKLPKFVGLHGTSGSNNCDTTACYKLVVLTALGASVVSAGSLAYALRTAKVGDPSLISSHREMLHHKFSADKVCSLSSSTVYCGCSS
jgi:hypothetical protein